VTTTINREAFEKTETNICLAMVRLPTFNMGFIADGEMCNLGAVYSVMDVAESAGYSHLISKKALL